MKALLLYVLNMQENSRFSLGEGKLQLKYNSPMNTSCSLCHKGLVFLQPYHPSLRHSQTFQTFFVAVLKGFAIHLHGIQDHNLQMISSFLLMLDEEVKITCKYKSKLLKYKSKLLASKNELSKQIFYFFTVTITSTFSFGILHFTFEHLKSKTRKLVF